MTNKRSIYVYKESPDFIQQIAEAYLKPYATMQSVAKRIKCSVKKISNLLYRGVTDKNILNDHTAIEVVGKAKRYSHNPVLTSKRWDGAMKLRNRSVEDNEELKALEDELELILYQIITYDDTAFSEDFPSKEELELKLEAIKNEIKKYK